MSIQFLKSKFVEILRNTEKYTKTDMVYLASGGFWSLFSQGIGSFASFIVVWLFANTLTKESFGEYRFFISILPMLTIFTLPGTGITLMRSVARGNKVDLPEIIRAKINWSLIGSVVALIAACYYFFQNNLDLTYAMIMTAFLLPFIETYYIYSSYYKGRQDFKTSAIYESLSRLFQSVILIIAIFISHSVLVLFGAFLIGQILARYFFYRKTLEDMKKHPTGNSLDTEDDTIIYGKYLSLSSVVHTVTNNMDILIVGHFLGPTMLAIYYIALAIPKNIVLVFNIIPRIAFPKFSKKNWDKEEYFKIIRKLGIMFGGLLFAAVTYSALAPFIINIFFKDYDASIPVSILLSAIIVLAPLNAMVAQILYARKFVKKIIFLNILVFAVFAIVFLLTYKAWGALGAATALIISESVALLVGLLLIKD